MKSFLMKYWRWLIVGASACFIPWVYFLFGGVFYGNIKFFLLIVFLVFLGLTFLVFRLLHLSFTLGNILLVDLAYLPLILTASKVTLRHSVWVTAVATLLLLMAAYILHRIYKGEMNFRVKRVLILLAVAGLAGYNCFYAVILGWQRQDGTSFVQASYVYTIRNEETQPNDGLCRLTNITCGRLNTLQDLNKYCQLYRNYLELDKEHNGFPSFLEISQKYDSSFFQTYALLVLPLGTGSSSIRYQIEEYNLQAASLFSEGGWGMRYRRYIPATLAEEQLSCYAFLPVPKKYYSSLHGESLTGGFDISVTDTFIPQFDLKNHTKESEFSS